MVAYAIEDRHHDNLLSGTELFALRQPGEKRHARIGEAVTIRRVRSGPAVLTAACSYRGRVLLAERGIVRVLNPSFTFEGERVFRLFAAAEQGSPQADEHLAKVARFGGFDTWPDLVRWHAEQGAPDENGLLAREVIGFSDVVRA